MRVALSCVLVARVAGGEHGAILPGMTLRRGDVADAAVAVLLIIPMYEARRPLSGGVQVDEPLERELRPILRCAEQCLGESIVITNARTRVGWLDAEPMQHGQNRRCLQGCAVVAVQHRTHWLGMHPLGERRSPGQVSSVLGTVSVMHLEADDLTAVEVQDQVEVEPASLDLRRQERHVPAPDVAGTGGDVRGRWARRPWWPGSPSAVHLAMCAQHTMEAGLTGDVDTLVGQCRDNPRRRRLGEARFVGHRDDPRPFGLAQSVRWDRALSVRPAIPLYQTVTGLPAPQCAGVDAGQSTGRGEPGSVRAGVSNVTHQDLAVFQAGHASSPSWKTAESFFDRTSKAAVSASALSLR